MRLITLSLPHSAFRRRHDAAASAAITPLRHALNFAPPRHADAAFDAATIDADFPPPFIIAATIGYRRHYAATRHLSIPPIHLSIIFCFARLSRRHFAISLAAFDITPLLNSAIAFSILISQLTPLRHYFSPRSSILLSQLRITLLCHALPEIHMLIRLLMPLPLPCHICHLSPVAIIACSRLRLQLTLLRYAFTFSRARHFIEHAAAVTY